MSPSPHPLPIETGHRLERIAYARQVLLIERAHATSGLLAPWVERSWKRSMGWGHDPRHETEFEVLTAQQMRRTTEGNAQLVQSARPLLETLARAIANTHYFAILTNADGVVVDACGEIDRSDRRADLVTRIGTDLSERSVGTTAIGAALTDLQPVWLHRGEHFFANTGHYSCAGAPLMGPDGRCIGMLDLTGIDAVERPELKHLAAQTASKIENALVIDQPHSMTLRLNWPGNTMGGDTDGLLCLDADGWITGANPAARLMVSALSATEHAIHANELFGMPFHMLCDAARRARTVLDVPLWTGLRLQVVPVQASDEKRTFPMHALEQRGVSLKDREVEVIRRAVEEARGNVAQAAHALGISRATVYRKLNLKH
jgi:transcriptional regulator of acetoin/glycerol metabolism